MSKHKSKLLTAGMAGILAAAALLGGTFAWQSISQGAINEMDSAVNPGGRLHDDFDGTNKDIYIENFTADDGSGMPIFARIRLYEYMETGPDAGTNLQGGLGRDVEVVGGTTHQIGDTSTWIIHTYDHDTVPADGQSLHSYAKWQMGGSTVYMPTFNMDKDSLKSDINGTFAGPDGYRPDDPLDTEDKYQDYVKYTVGATQVGTEIHDGDEDSLDNNGIITVPGQTHTAKATPTATVLSMAEWKDLGSPPGNFWVYDTDGWAYWASAIQPSTATGLLLNGLNFVGATSGDWYYAIYVEAQLATAFDWGDQETGDGFYKDGFTEDGKTVLENAANVVVGENGKQYINCGNNTYKEILPDEPYLSDLICAGMDTTIGNEDDRTDVVELGDDDDKSFGDKLLGPNDGGFYQAAGPDGLLGTADDILLTDATSGDDNPFDDLEEVKVTLTITPRVGKELGTDLKAKPGDKVPFGVDAFLDEEAIDAAEVEWSVSGSNMAAGTTIADGDLTIAADQAVGSTITVTAQFQGKTDQVQLAVVDQVLDYDDIHSVVPGATTKLSIDGYEWYVLVKDNVGGSEETEALLYETDGAIKFVQGFNSGSVWGWVGSYPQTTQFPPLLDKLTTLKPASVEVQLHSRNNKMQWSSSQDKIFPLTEADLFGTIKAVPTSEAQDYTYTVDGVGQVLVFYQEIRKSEGQQHLRNYCDSSTGSHTLPDGTLMTDYGVWDGDQVRFRPALWVTIPKSAE